MTEHDTTSQTPTQDLEPAPPARSPGITAGRLAIGMILILIGAGALVETANWAEVPWELLLPILLMVVGIAMIATAQQGRHRGLFVFGVILTVLLAMGTTFRVSIGGGVGDRLITVTSIEQLEDRYELGVGNLTLDLRELALPSGLTEIHARVGIGDLVVILPSTADVFVEARASIGSVALPDGSNDGLDARRSYRTPGYDTATGALRLELRASIGSIEVRA